MSNCLSLAEWVGGNGLVGSGGGGLLAQEVCGGRKQKQRHQKKAVLWLSLDSFRSFNVCVLNVFFYMTVAGNMTCCWF